MKIHYIQPYALDKNIGKAYNEACALIPDGDWICITDHDVMFLEPETKTVIYKAVEANKHDAYVCMTNRLGYTDQLYKGERSDDPDIRNHIEIAKKQRFTWGRLAFDYYGPVAGMFLLFSKKTWEANKFAEGVYLDVCYDIHFGECIRNKGGKIGILGGVYVFHLYRFGQQEPQGKVGHLIP